MNKSESKYFNTAIKMNEAFLLLLEKKELEYITVKEICSVSGVNRSTFYLHYETIDDLLVETSEYINTKFSSYFKHIDFDFQKIALEPKENLILITPEFLSPWLNFIKDNKRLFSTIISRFDSLRLGKSQTSMMNDVIFPILERFEISDENKSYIMAFYFEGIKAIIKEWIKHDCKKDIAEIEKMIINCILLK